MTHSILKRALQQAACCLACLAFAAPTFAQSTENMTILANFGRGDGDTRTVFALGTRAYYGLGNNFQIADFTNPATPVVLGTASTPDRVEDVVVVGNTAYVSSGDGVHIFNIQNPTAIMEVGVVAANSYGEGLAVDPPYVLFGDGSGGLRIIDATDPASPTQVSAVDTLGYVEGLSYSGGVAYVAAGSRVHMIDYSDPANPTYAGRIGSPIDYYQSTTIRGNFLYIADFFGGLRIFDVSNPATPLDVGFFDPADRTARIALDGDFAYLANGDKGVTILNVSTPASPVEVAVVDTPIRALQTWVAGTLLYVADTEGVQVFDVSDTANPTLAGTIDVNSPASGKAFGINIDGDYAYVAYGDAGLRILDATAAASSITEVAQVDITNGAGDGSARQVAISGNYAYVASRSAGVRIVDVTTPGAASVVDSIDVADAGDVSIDGNLMAVAGGSGVTVFSIADPMNPNELFASDTLGYADRVGVSGSYVYAITTGSHVRVFDATDTTNVALVGSVATGGDYSEGRITVVGDMLFTTNGDLLIVDVSDKANPSVAGAYDAPSYSYSANVMGDFAFVATEREGIRLVDVSDPSNPVEVGFASPGDQMRDVAFGGGLIFAANGESGVTTIRNDLATANESAVQLPREITLHQNFPNPFAGETAIRFELHTGGEVRLDVYNVLGQRVATLLDERRPAGTYTVALDSKGLGSGTYFYRLRSGEHEATRTMVVLR